VSKFAKMGRSGGGAGRVGRRLAAVAAVSALALTSACGSGSSGGSGAGGGVTDSTIKIGTTSPLTGVLGTACTPSTNGAKAWFDHVNDEGGIHGRTIDSKVLDDQYQAPLAVANAKTFVADDVFALYGGCGSIQPPATYPLVHKAGILSVFPYASLADFAEKPGYYSVATTYGDQNVSLVKGIFKDKGPGSVAILTVQKPGSKEEAAAVEKAVTDGGGTFQGNYETPTSVSDYTPYLLKMKAKSPDYVILSTTASGAAVIVKTMEQNNFYPKKALVGGSQIIAESFVSAVDDTMAAKVVLGSPTVAGDSPDAKTCVDVLTAAKVTVEGTSLFGCASAQVFTEALDEAGKDLTRDAFVDVLEGWKDKKASPLFGGLTFDKTRHIGPTELFILGIENGQLTTGGTYPVV
jgi:branched-chain amino acid transport system substrate-binding protein